MQRKKESTEEKKKKQKIAFNIDACEKKKKITEI